MLVSGECLKAWGLGSGVDMDMWEFPQSKHLTGEAGQPDTAPITLNLNTERSQSLKRQSLRVQPCSENKRTVPGNPQEEHIPSGKRTHGFQCWLCHLPTPGFTLSVPQFTPP